MPIQAGSAASGVTINPGDWTGTLTNALTGVSINFGPATPYQLVAEGGLKGWKQIGASPLGGAGQLAPKFLNNGSWKVPHLYPYRDVAMQFYVSAAYAGSTPWATVIANLEAVTINDPTNTSTLSIQLDNLSTQVVGTVLTRDIPTDFAYQFGFCIATVVFRAPDPRRLGTALVATTGTPSTSGGLAFPAAAPFQFTGSVSNGSVVLTNGGTATGPLVVTFNGPVTGPSITQAETGLVVAFSNSLTVNSGDTLVVDMDNLSALYNNNPLSSRSNYITNRGWQKFRTGMNTFQFNASGSSTGSMQVTATPAWL